MECGINELTYVISVSRSHNIANVRRTPEESMEQFKTLIQEYGHKIDFRLALATALGCPFGEEIRTERVAEWCSSAWIWAARKSPLPTR